MAVFIARGTSFLFSKTLMNTMAPMAVLAVRFVAAFFVLAAVFHKKLLHCSRKSLHGGLILGVLYTVCMTFEMFGLRLIDSGVSSLIENMAIVMVPVFAAIVWKSPLKKKTLFCAGLAVAGVGFLSLTQTGGKNGGLGIILIVLAAMTYAVCIMVTEKVSQDADPLTIGMIQLGTMGALSFSASALTWSFSLPQGGSQWTMMLLLVMLCSCFGFAFQPLGQKFLPAEEAAVLTVVNPLTASIMGIAIAGESISIAKAIGYIMILTALIVYNSKLSMKSNSKKRDRAVSGK